MRIVIDVHFYADIPADIDPRDIYLKIPCDKIEVRKVGSSESLGHPDVGVVVDAIQDLD